ncbi:hypothetical protein FOA43_001193 [Brettanomyces nanus]|uniref:DNL-type domain-containing protein n=1 Tax=Eeniella nana TaxID=13502 RepID=A0A875RYT5_EENNA|nr:uncharacterized protein FOA43_001193 [Brettanomyces nanus]QPG73878.1 hypothetical protein FOA43_001193 [Brettanomyces nanus]
MLNTFSRFEARTLKPLTRLARQLATTFKLRTAVRPAAEISHKSAHRNFNTTSRAFDSSKDDQIKIDKPSLMLAFTCKKCGKRSSHIISKQAYVKGSVLVQCPECKNRHLIADHLNVFHDGKINIEDIMRSQGQRVSLDTSDLCFEDIPESLKGILGDYAEDSPPEYKKKENICDTDMPILPGNKEKD